MNFKEMIAYTGISKSKAYKAVMNKELPYYKPTGGKNYFLKKDVDAWILQGRVPSKAEIKAMAESTAK